MSKTTNITPEIEVVIRQFTTFNKNQTQAMKAKIAKMAIDKHPVYSQSGVTVEQIQEFIEEEGL